MVPSSALRRSFHTKTPRGSGDDPWLYLRLFHAGRAFLFDLGDLGQLAPREILRVEDAFVTHAHMDHFAGFDRLLRLHLNRSERLRVFGPRGFLDRIEGKLRGYDWNLTAQYPFRILASEVDGSRVKRALFPASRGFDREDLPETAWDGILLEEPGFRIRGAVLDHGIPCLGYRFEENLQVRILAGELQRRGLVAGNWLGDLKAAVRAGAPGDTPVRVKSTAGWGRTTLGDLEGLYRTGPGQAVVYIMDSTGCRENLEKIVVLAQKAQLLYIEAAFLSGDAHLASARGHLTAAEAGLVARKASVQVTRLMHASPRYAGRESDLIEEARGAAGPGVRLEGGWKEWAT